ncbi:hypothetical protein [Parasediminibacterium sp. JCM 36343]|uniref:hypothetical protein n=1 Tax=Parasediminibacterium sp. JCM 36343 TaxID=3374279 RepID=UPI00397E43C0
MGKIIIVLSFLILSFFSCKKEDDLYRVGSNSGPDLNDIITFTNVSNNQIDADSVSNCILTVKINSQSDDASRNVTFITSGGTFSNNDTLMTVQVDALGYATVALKNNMPEMVRVKASVKTFIIDTLITFNLAAPDDILISADKYLADTSNNITISTNLFRNPGRGVISDPVKVYYQITPLDTSINLVYPGFAFSEKHVSSIIVSNPFKVSGRFNIKSKVVGSSSDTLTKTILVKIK